MTTIYGMPIELFIILLATLLAIVHAAIWPEEIKPLTLPHVTLKRVMTWIEYAAIGVGYVIIGCGLGFAFFALVVTSNLVRF